jgi:hypothetical protein
MDEQAINGAAIEAIRDLELDCEIKDVCERDGRNGWCIQFSGKYGQFCDEFKGQFGDENSHQVMREKIKRHLIKQVNKIRSSTGRKRRAAVGETSRDSQPEEGGILSAPLKMLGEVFDRVAGVTGVVVDQASTAADAARDAVADMAANITPVTIEVRSSSPRDVEKSKPAPAGKKTVKASKATTRAKAKKATKRIASGAVGKQVKKSGKAAGQPRKAAKKVAGKKFRAAR